MGFMNALRGPLANNAIRAENLSRNLLASVHCVRLRKVLASDNAVFSSSCSTTGLAERAESKYNKLIALFACCAERAACC